MKTDVGGGSLRAAALISGWALMVMTVAAVVGNDLTIRSLVVVGDAEATVRNVTASETVFRLGVLSWLTILIADVLAAFGLYLFMRPVNDRLALLMAWTRLAYVAVLGAAIDNLVQVTLLIGSQAPPSTTFADAAPAVMRALSAFDQTWSLGLVVFGIHVLLLGVLILRSSYVPRIFGIVLLVAAFGYIVTHVSGFLLPNHKNLARTLGWICIGPMLGELALGVWLLLKGGKPTLAASGDARHSSDPALSAR